MLRSNFRFLVIVAGYLGFIFGTSGTAFGAGLDVHEIYRYKVCAPYVSKDGVPPSLTDAQAVAIDDPKYFPPWGTGIGTYVRALDKLNAAVSPEGACGNKGALALPLMSALAETSRKTAELIVDDILDQKNQMKRVSACLHALDYMKLDSDKPVSATDFSDQSPATADAKGKNTCARMTNFLVEDLGERFRAMRMYMALQVTPDKIRKPLKHDVPFSSFVTKHVFASQATRVSDAPGLDDREAARLPEFSREIPVGRNARELYEQMISTTPILLQIRGKVTPRTIQDGVDQILKQYSFDEKAFMETLSQNIFLNTPYVAAAIESMPEEKRSNACLATSAIYSRLKIQYEKSPQFLATLALMYAMPLRALSAADVALGGIMKEFAQKTAVGIVPVSGVHAVQLYDRFKHGIEMCSTIYRQEHVDPNIDGICTLSKTNRIQEDAEAILIANTAIIGVLKFGRPLLSIYSKYGAAK